MKTTTIHYVWFMLLSCNTIISMERLLTSSSSSDTEYYVGHKLERTYEHSDGITHIAYSPLKKQPFFIVGSEDNSISLWHEDGTSAFQSVTEQQITSLAISPNAQEIAVGTLGERPTVMLYDINTGKFKTCIQFADDEEVNRITDISYSPSGDFGTAVLQDGRTSIWNPKNNGPVTTIPSTYLACSARILSNNIIRIATRNGKIHTLPITQLSPLEKFNMKKNLPESHMISRPVLSQDGQECIASFIPHITSKPNETTVCIFDILHKTFVDIAEGHGISHASFSQDHLVCASIFGRILTTYHRVSEPGIDGFNHVVTHSSIPSTTPTAIACSPDGSHMVTSLRPQTIALWRLIKECQTIQDR